MKKLNVLAGLLLLIVGGVIGFQIYQRHQKHSQWLKQITHGDQLYQDGKYQEALSTYQQADQVQSTPETQERIRLAEEAWTIEYPKIIMKALFETYANLTSYQDSGERIATTKIGGTTTSVTSSFETSWAASGRFKFTFTPIQGMPETGIPVNKHILWADGKNAFHYNAQLQQYKAFSALTPEIADATLSDVGNALVVPALLYGEQEGLSTLEELSASGKEPIEDNMCIVLKATSSEGAIQYTLWVDEQLSLLRKTHVSMNTTALMKAMLPPEERQKEDISNIPETSMRVEVMYHMHAINETIPEERFTFELPEEAQLVEEWEFHLDEKLAELQQKLETFQDNDLHSGQGSSNSSSAPLLDPTKDAVKIIATAPSSPARVNVRERFQVTVAYNIVSTEEALIFVRPSKMVRNASYTYSPSYGIPEGAGEVERSISFKQPDTVKEIVVTMEDRKTGIKLAEIFYPVDVKWDNTEPKTADSLQVISINPPPRGVLQLGQRLQVTIRYTIDSVEEAVILVQPASMSEPGRFDSPVPSTLRKGSGEMSSYLAFNKPMTVYEMIIIMKDRHTGKELQKTYYEANVTWK